MVIFNFIMALPFLSVTLQSLTCFIEFKSLFNPQPLVAKQYEKSSADLSSSADLV